MIQSYYVVVETKDYPEYTTRQYHLRPNGLDNPAALIVGLFMPPGDIPIELEDGDEKYTVHSLMAHRTIAGDLDAVVYLNRGTQNAT